MFLFLNALFACSPAPEIDLEGVWTGALSDCDDPDVDGAGVTLTLVGGSGNILVPGALEDASTIDGCTFDAQEVDMQGTVIDQTFPMDCEEGRFTFDLNLAVSGPFQEHTASGEVVVTFDGDTLDCMLTLTQDSLSVF